MMARGRPGLRVPLMMPSWGLQRRELRPVPGVGKSEVDGNRPTKVRCNRGRCRCTQLPPDQALRCPVIRLPADCGG